MVTSTRSGQKNEIIDFNISGGIKSHQPANSDQDDEKMQSPNSDQQITPSIKTSRLKCTVDSICKMQIEFPCQALRKKCSYLELFWYLFSGIRTEYGMTRNISAFSPNAGKHGPE